MNRLTEYGKLNAPITTVTRDLGELMQDSSNAYELCVLLAKRADQISQELREELLSRLEDFALINTDREGSVVVDSDLFEDEGQIDMSRQYERLPKPTLLALQERLNGVLIFHYDQPEAAESDAAAKLGLVQPVASAALAEAN